VFAFVLTWKRGKRRPTRGSYNKPTDVTDTIEDTDDVIIDDEIFDFDER
jgi:hypothetical protein